MAKPFGGMGGGAAMPRPMPNPRLNPLPTSPAPSRPGLFANMPIQKRFDMAMDLLKNGMQMGAESGSPLMAFLSPLAGAAIGGGIENKRAKLMGEQNDELMASMMPLRRSRFGSDSRKAKSFTTAKGTAKLPIQFFLPK